MTAFAFPAAMTSDYLSLKREIRDPSRLRSLLTEGWRAFQEGFGERIQRVRQGLLATGMETRFGDFLAQVLRLQADLLFHVDFRCRSYAVFLEAHRLDPQNPDLLGALIRMELTHLKLRDAALHLFEARRVGIPVPELDLLEEDLEQALAEKLEEQFWDRVRETEGALALDPNNTLRLAELGAELFYEALDLVGGEKYLGRALELGSRDPEAWFSGAEIAFEAGEHTRALQRVERMMELAPGDGRGRLLRMNILCRLGREQEALGLLREAVGVVGKPLVITLQDLFFQGSLQVEEDYHQSWLQLLRRLQVSPDGAGYYYSSGTPHGFFEAQLEAARVYHLARLATLALEIGDPVEEIHEEFQKLLKQAPEYTFLMDEAARFLLRAYPGKTDLVVKAGKLAERAVHLAETAGEPEARFHATLAAARRTALGRAG
jgi:tetratricopeptide (TPR) repeat protein